MRSGREKQIPHSARDDNLKRSELRGSEVRGGGVGETLRGSGQAWRMVARQLLFVNRDLCY
jgi:hypothetical protein